MKNIWKYILIAFGVVILEWIWLGIFPSFFNGLPQEQAVTVGVGFFLAFELVICTGVIVSKISKK